MSLQNEGVHASYVGHSRDGLEMGDRCFVLSDEGRAIHVRWTTGSRTGEYDMLPPTALVFDAQASHSDEFGFEIDIDRMVSVACREILDRGGDVALFQALEEAGHLSLISRCAKVAVAQAREAVMNDPAWMEVVADLGPDGDRVTSEALKLAVVAIMESEDSDEVE